MAFHSPPPRDDLVRAVFPGPEFRASTDAEGGAPRLVGHFARYNEWAEIHSDYEGHFLERIAPGAFARTIQEDRAGMRVLFQHGRDPQIGDKPLGPIEELEEDEEGVRYVVRLLDTSYNRDLEPALREGLYGASFRFSVREDKWVKAPARSKDNPDGLPERTIFDLRAREFGPVTWGAYANATAGIRSLTDSFRAPMPAEPQPQETPPVELENPQVLTRDEKAARVTELEAEITKLGTEYSGVLPDPEQARWNSMTEELDALERDIAAYDARMSRIQRLAQSERTSVPVDAPSIIRRPSESDIFDVTAVVRNSRTKEEMHSKIRDNAMRANDQMRVPSGRYDQDKSRERLGNLIDFADSDDKELALRVLNTNSPQYRSAFNRYVLSGGQERGTALAVGVDGTGGFSVPVSFDPTIVAIGAHAAINPIRSTCRVETIVGTDTWQALTATAITAAYATEAAAATEQGPTFARPEFIAKRAHAFVTVSYEMAQDRPSLPGDLGTLFGEAKDNLEDTQFTIGLGTGVLPEGIGLKDAITRADSAGAAVAVADVLAMEAALPIRHRLNAAWYLSRAAIRAIQAWETVNGQLFNGQQYASVGNPVGRGGGNTGLQLLGYPVYETPSMPWTPATTDTTWGVLMAPKSCYVVVDRVGMSIKVIPDMLNGATPSFPTGEIGIYAFWRNTARVLNADAGRQGAVQ
jgi:HK97 family phage major capsid protein/HK97 family phage prohead protease